MTANKEDPLAPFREIEDEIDAVVFEDSDEFLDVFLRCLKAAMNEEESEDCEEVLEGDAKS